jgi:succinate dehydrogenase / fumarate reductase, cytochrome b subunit
MNWILQYINSSIGKKQVMAVTGLLLAAFLLIHFVGNIPLFYPLFGQEQHAKHALNLYAAFLQYKGIVIYGFEAVMLFLFAAHGILGFMTYFQNKAARGPRGYEVEARKGDHIVNKTWMIVSGVVILVFLVFHVASFKYDLLNVYKEGNAITGKAVAEYDYVPAALVAEYDKEVAAKVWNDHVSAQEDAEAVATAAKQDPTSATAESATAGVAMWKVHNLYGKVAALFHTPWYAALYLFAMVFLAIHLGHAIQSAMQTLGLNHPRYNALIKWSGLGYTLFIAGGNIAITVCMYASQFLNCH